MEITWTYNWLETIGFLLLTVFGGICVFYAVALLWLNGNFKGWR